MASMKRAPGIARRAVLESEGGPHFFCDSGVVGEHARDDPDLASQRIHLGGKVEIRLRYSTSRMRGKGRGDLGVTDVEVGMMIKPFGGHRDLLHPCDAVEKLRESEGLRDGVAVTHPSLGGRKRVLDLGFAKPCRPHPRPRSVANPPNATASA